MLSMTIEQAVERTGITRSRLYELFKEGALVPRKSGRRTLILANELEDYVKGLPAGVTRNGS